jgi:Ca2+-binding EF-hand superfamily protein
LDKNGYLDKEEIKKSLNETFMGAFDVDDDMINEIINMMDTNKDGKIKFDGYLIYTI